MRRPVRLLAPLLALLAAGPALAQAAAADPAPAASDSTDARRPPLFVVGAGDARVYLLGSVHVLPDGALPLPAHVEAAYAQASVLAFELDLDLAQAGATGMMAAAMDEVTIGEALTAAQSDSLNAALALLGMPAGALDALEPWFASMMYGVMALQQSGLPLQEGGVDAHFFGRAKADGKERLAFETVELQTAAFDDLTTATQVAYLLESIRLSPDSLATQFADLVEAWGSGDDERLAAMMSQGMSHPEVFESLLITRNRAWIPQIESLLAGSETALVVVGAGHLVGEGSVVDMLRRAGYAVERL